MRVFEFHFNPSASDFIFDSFCFEPENIYEKKLGNVYIAALLKNALPQNARLLNELAKTIKDSYYKLANQNPEKALKESLKKANEFLEAKAKSGDVSWLGNFNFTALSVKNFDLNFTKVGSFKIYLLRAGECVDIERGLKFDEIEPYPLKIFGNIVSGTLAKDDMIVVLTKEIAEYFKNQSVLTEIAALFPFDDKKLRAILNGRMADLSKIAGMCLMIRVNEEEYPARKEILAQKYPPKNYALIFKNFPRKIFPAIKIKIPSLNILKTVSLKLPWLEKPAISSIKIAKISGANRKLAALLATLLGILLFGYLLSQMERKQNSQEAQKILAEIRQKTDEAESLLILEKNNPELVQKANALLKAGYEKTETLLNSRPGLKGRAKEEAEALYDKISAKLFLLNKMVQIRDPEIYFEAQSANFIPEKIVFFKENVYLFNSFGDALLEINSKKEQKIIPAGENINYASAAEKFLLLFSKPDKIMVLEENGSISKNALNFPFSNVNFRGLASFKTNLYFLTQETGEIIKYGYLGGESWGLAQKWLRKQNISGGESIAVDGSVWVLGKNNIVSRYYFGEKQEEISLDIFPAARNFSKIYISPSLPYIYILEPAQKRIIIAEKNGAIVKQFQSAKFDNLLDFTVSEDGAIYLLDGQKVYRLVF